MNEKPIVQVALDEDGLRELYLAEVEKCLRKLELQTGLEIHEWEQWEEPYRREAEILISHMNMILQHYNEKLLK